MWCNIITSMVKVLLAAGYMFSFMLTTITAAMRVRRACAGVAGGVFARNRAQCVHVTNTQGGRANVEFACACVRACRAPRDEMHATVRGDCQAGPGFH